jgi:ABC-2 type transport system permease protein
MLALSIPMLLIMLFGYALNLDVDDVPTVVWDQSRTPESRELVSLFNGSPYFTIMAESDNYRDLQRLLDRGRATAALIIPADFADAVLGQRPVEAQVIIDGSNANTGRLVMGYASALGLIYNRQLSFERLQSLGSGGIPAVVDLDARAWYNLDLRSSDVIIPAIIAIVMMVIAALLTSVTIAREWELGTMEQLISTPVRGPELVLGKLAPYFAIGILDVLIAVAMGQWVFEVPLRGNVGLLFAMASVFLVGALSMGITFSITLKKQVLAIQMALIGTFLPAMLLSGFVFAIANMPRAIQLLTYIVPARYFIALLRGIYLKGIGLEILWFDAVLLAIWAAVMLAVANRRIRLKLA